MNTAVVTPTSGSSSAATVPNVTIGPFRTIQVSLSPTLAASGVTLATPPPAGSTIPFPLTEDVIQATSNSVADSTLSARLFYVGTQTNGGTTVPLYKLVVPTLTGPASQTAPAAGDPTLPGDGSIVTLGDGSKLSLGVGNLNYASAGIWSYTSATGSSLTVGNFVTGYQTPFGNVPTSGSASFVGDGSALGSRTGGGVAGEVYIPNGSGGISVGTLTGTATVGVNFSSGAVSGALSNMTSTAVGGAVTPWNSVNLSGTLASGQISGTTSTSGPPTNSGAYGEASYATGKFAGALYGPNGQELGAVWTLDEQGGFNTKGAIGVIAATKQ